MNNELFTTAPVHKTYFKLAVPVVLGMIIGLVYNLVDTYFIALTGQTNLIAGVSLIAPVLNLFIAIGDIWGLGGSSLISRLFGQNELAAGRRINAFCFYAAIGTGLLFLSFMLVFRSAILQILGADADTLPYASAYYTYIVLGCPFVIANTVPSNTLRTEGLANESMIGNFIGSIINIILDPIFIFSLGLGAAGAAIATVIGNASTFIYYIWITLRKSGRLSLSIHDCRADLSALSAILAIGIPGCLTNIMESFAMLVKNRYFLPFGTDTVAALGLATKVNSIAILILVGFAFGPQPVIGFNYGAKNTARLNQVLKFCFSFECALGLVFTAVLSAMAPSLIGLFIKDPVIITTGAQILRTSILGTVFMSYTLVATCVFQSLGKGLPAFLLTISRQGVFLFVIMTAASKLFGYQGVLYAQPVTDLFAGLFGMLLYFIFVAKEMKSI